MRQFLTVSAVFVILAMACRPKPELPPIVEEPKFYELKHTDFEFVAGSKVYLDSSLHIHASSPAWAVAKIKKGTYDLTVIGYGQQGPSQEWPIMGISLDSASSASGPNIVASTVLDTSVPDSHYTRIRLLQDSTKIYIWLTNDAYEKGIGDVNLFLRKIIFKPIETKQVELVWDSNSEPDLAGYRIYQGISSRNYVQMNDVGNQTFVVWIVEKNVKYYFAATAYDSAGNESDFSEEVEVLMN